jgi:acyl carrier protein
MDETQNDSNLPARTESAGQPASRPDMTVAEMREWLRKAVATATGQSADAIDETTPLIELGLSSRDAVAMASDIEDLTGVTLTATVLFRHPTIESLATVIIEGEPEPEDTGDEDWSRDRDVEDIAIVGVATRFPGDMNTPDEMWTALLEGRDAITDLPEGRWEEFLAEHPGRIPQGHQGFRLRILRAVEDGSRQHRPAAAHGAGAHVGSVGARQDSCVEPAWHERRGIHRQFDQRLQLPGHERSVGRAPIRHHRNGEFHHRQPGFVLLRFPRPLGRGGHRVLELVGCRAPRCAGAAVG